MTTTEVQQDEQRRNGSQASQKKRADLALDQHAIVAMTAVHGTITYVKKYCAISQYHDGVPLING
jgi:hypothetical protein